MRIVVYGNAGYFTSSIWKVELSAGDHNTVHSGYKGHVYKGQPVIRDRLAGTELFPFILV